MKIAERAAIIGDLILQSLPATDQRDRREQRGRYGGGPQEGSREIGVQRLRLQQLLLWLRRRSPQPPAPVQRVVPRGAAERLLPLCRAARIRAHDESPRPQRQDGRGPRARQPRFVQLPGHLVPAGSQAGGDRGPAKVRPRRLRFADPLRDLRHPRGPGQGRGRVQGQGSGHPVPDRVQRERRLHLRHHALGPLHLLRSVLARVDRGRSDPGQVQDRLLPPQQPDGPGTQAQRGAREEAGGGGRRLLDGRRRVRPARHRGRGQASRRAHPHRRGAFDLPLRAERPRRVRAFRAGRPGGLPPRHVLQEPGRPGRLRRGIKGARRLRDRLRPLPLLLLQPRPRPGRGPARGSQDRRERARAPRAPVEQRGLPPPPLRGGGHRHRQVDLAGHARHGQQRRQGLRGGGEDPGRRPLPPARDLSRGAEAQVAAAHLRIRRPLPAGARVRGGRDRPGPPRGGDLPGLTQYGYRDAISGFFEFPTENARRILPPNLEPVEVHHGTSVFALTAFDFNQSEVGAYGEVVMAVVVAPLVKPGQPFPKSAMYPYLVATTTKAARDHAIERWHLPHWMEDVDVRFDRQGKAVTARVEVDGSPVADLTITDYSWNPVSHLYQAFMKDDRGAYLASITMEGQQSEHEEETGRIQLHEHPFNKDLVISEIYEQPFREMWMREGQQTFEPLIQLQTV